MAFAIAGLATPGLGILGADCVMKTCPQFFDLLGILGTNEGWGVKCEKDGGTTTD